MVLRWSSMTARRTGLMSRSVLLGGPAAEEAVGLLVGRLLPRGSGLAEVHLDAEGFFDVGPAGHLAALVPCEGFGHVGGLAGQRLCDGPGGGVGVVAAGQRHHQGVAAGALDERGHRGAVGASDDQIALPSAGLGSGVGFGRPVGYGPEIAQRRSFCLLAAASGLSAAALAGQLFPRPRLQPASASVVIAGPVDGLRAHPQPPGPQVRADRMGRPPLAEALGDRRGQLEVTGQLGNPGPPRPLTRRYVRRLGPIPLRAATTDQLPPRRRAVGQF